MRRCTAPTDHRRTISEASRGAGRCCRAAKGQGLRAIGHRSCCAAVYTKRSRLTGLNHRVPRPKHSPAVYRGSKECRTHLATGSRRLSAVSSRSKSGPPRLSERHRATVENRSRDRGGEVIRALVVRHVVCKNRRSFVVVAVSAKVGRANTSSGNDFRIGRKYDDASSSFYGDRFSFSWRDIVTSSANDFQDRTQIRCGSG